MPFALADFIGTTVLFLASVAFMMGTRLRAAALTIALFVLGSSLVENFAPVEAGSLSAFWRDLTLACAVLLSRSSLDSRGLAQADLGGTRRAQHLRHVRPRRVTPTEDASRPLRRHLGTLTRTAGSAREDPANIFAES